MTPQQEAEIFNQVLAALQRIQDKVGVTVSDDSVPSVVNGVVFMTRTVTISDGKATITLLNATAPVNGDPAELKANIEQQQADDAAAFNARQQVLEDQKAIYDTAIAAKASEAPVAADPVQQVSVTPTP